MIHENIQGKLINNFDEYKFFIAKKHTKEWLKSSEREVYKVFGKPLRYPFVFIEVDKDYEDSAYSPTALVKVYF